MISNLPGKALRMMINQEALSSDLTCILEAESGKFDVKRREPGILVISYYDH